MKPEVNAVQKKGTNCSVSEREAKESPPIFEVGGEFFCKEYIRSSGMDILKNELFI